MDSVYLFLFMEENVINWNVSLIKQLIFQSIAWRCLGDFLKRIKFMTHMTKSITDAIVLVRQVQWSL